MSTVIITLYYPGTRSGRDLELPAEVPLRPLIPHRITALEPPSVNAADQPLVYQITTQQGQPPLREMDTLSSAGGDDR